MESALNNFSTTIITFAFSLLGAYIIITLAVHLGLKNVITNIETRNGIIKLTSVVTFGVIAMKML